MSAAGLAALPLLDACGSSGTTTTFSTSSAHRPVARVRLAASSSPVFGFPSPFAMTRGPGFVGMSYIFDQLVWDAKNGTRPWLASEYSFDSANTTATFKLRSGATFHDGMPVTADDVVFSIELIKAHPMPWTINTALILSATAVDPQTVKVVLKTPNAVFMNSDMSSLPVLPKHIWSSVGDVYKYMDPSALVGSGPYKLASFDQARGAYQFVANDKYVLGQPVVREVDYVPVADVLLALMNGDIDAGSPNAAQGIGTDALAPFQSDSRFGVLNGGGDVMTALYFNLAAGPPYNDVKFRQAVSHAVNVGELVQRVMQGSGTPGNPGWLAPKSPWYDPTVAPFTFDVQKASAMLDAAGYTMPAGGTTRNGLDGKPLALPVVFDNSQPRTVQVLQTQLQAVGITLQPHGLDFASLRSTASQGKYQLAILSLGGLSGDPDFNFQSFNANAPAGQQVFTKGQGYANTQFAALEEQQRTILDVNQRKQVVNQMQHIFADDLPAISLFYQPNIWIFDRGVFDGWYFTPGGIAGGNPGATNKSVFVTGTE